MDTQTGLQSRNNLIDRLDLNGNLSLHFISSSKAARIGMIGLKERAELRVGHDIEGGPSRRPSEGTTLDEPRPLRRSPSSEYLDVIWYRLEGDSLSQKPEEVSAHVVQTGSAPIARLEQWCNPFSAGLWRRYVCTM